MIGAGNMGQALIKGLLARGLPRYHLYAADADATIRRAVARRFRVAVGPKNLPVVRRAEVVILAVKPQQLPAVLAQIQAHVTGRHLVISIAAGITLRWLQRRLPGIPVVRVMPNLPATVGCGFSVLTMGRGVSARQRAIARALFKAVGEVVELPERQFDAVTAVSGSGPAYVFFLVRLWQEAARTLGLSPAIAATAIGQTLEGSVRVLRASGVESGTLIQRVASKGGTTEAALKVLARRSVSRHFVEAIRAAAARSRTLSWH